MRQNVINIIIPTYNEKNNIRPLIEKIVKLPTKNLEIIIVDDNSPDGTGKIADEIASQYHQLTVIHRQKKQGLGRAYLDVFNKIIRKEIPADFIITMDADFSHPIDKIPEIIEKLEQGHELVVGSRYIPGGSTQGWNFKRRFLSRNANQYAKVITGIPINDLTAGFVGYNVKTLKKIDLSQIKSNGYAFQIEMKYQMIKAGARFTEVPITFVDREQGKSKFNKSIFWEAVFIPWKLRL
ncbi:polyprenol monophosphomannose synthase [Patescibacteria group bacterium]|nr:polyprenol monophosphomannose synthase [Patescibacteria group bacterium]MBU4512396.1 polyprenol monophosphomannose synthase [Patescibacteria group bacterium]MCG2692970.1 polyprenol monophosphomannose synthase [Candidatus Parcubacteria bacterium]